MLRFRCLFSAKFTQSSFSTRHRKLSTSHYLSSENKDPTEGEKKPVDEKSKEAKQTDVNERLKFLIKSMEVSTQRPLVADQQFARPKRRGFVDRSKTITNETKAVVQAEGIANAAKEVAKSFGGDVKQMEMQLLSKVASQSAKAKGDERSSSSSSTSSSSDSDSSSSDDEASPTKKGVIAPEPKTKTPADDKPKTVPFNLSELIVGMKIDRSQSVPVEGRASQVRKALGSRSAEEYQPWKENAANNNERRNNRRNDRGNDMRNEDRRDMKGSRKFRDRTSADFNRAPIEVKLFSQERLGIFDVNKPVKTEVDQLATWQTLKKREVRLAGTHPPANYFEEMIFWTEQGKLWKFPIDNEQDQDLESGVSFAEHVFLEPLLEPWCPRKGPVRHFMELVCVGLSKNHYLTAAEKRSHIDWFRDYFEAKRDVLLETGALEAAEVAGVGREAAAAT